MWPATPNRLLFLPVRRIITENSLNYAHRQRLTLPTAISSIDLELWTRQADQNPKSRLEAFSDGVLAIIITIMVLELKVPHGADFEALTPLMPIFSATC